MCTSHCLLLSGITTQTWRSLIGCRERVEVRPENPERRAAQGIDGKPPLPGERFTPLVSIPLVVDTT
jgi:hypothetical protein